MSHSQYSTIDDIAANWQGWPLFTGPLYQVISYAAYSRRFQAVHTKFTSSGCRGQPGKRSKYECWKLLSNAVKPQSPWESDLNMGVAFL